MVSASGVRAAEVCVTNASGPDICVDFDLGTPVEDTHFEVEYGDPANPGVKLITGAAWNVRSDDNGSAGNIGAIQIDTGASLSANFELTIADGVDAGAVDVESIALVHPNGGWTGHSSITGGKIAGTLTSDLTVVDDATGAGGSCTFEIQGDALGDITIHKLGTVIIRGRTSGSIKVDELVEYGYCQIGSGFTDCSLTGPAAITGEITIGLIPYLGLFEIDGHLAANLQVGAILGGDVHVVGAVGDVRIQIDEMVPSQGRDAFLFFISNEEPVCGFHGDLILVGGIPGHALVQFIGRPLEVGASIDLMDADVGGVLKLSAGGSGSIINGGTVKPEGRVTLANGTSFGTTGAFSGKAEFRGLESLPGYHSFIKTANGADLAGTLTIKESIDGPVKIDGKLRSKGRILIGGTCNGPITIGENTERYSLIHVVEGIADDGRITINANEGDFNALGDIHVGPVTWTELPDVTFTGCVCVRNELCSVGPCPGGNLRADITVVGCHAAATPDLNICVEGWTYGSITIVQDHCDYPVGLDDSCANPCPQ